VIRIDSFEGARLCYELPPGVANAVPVACVAFEEARRDYTFDMLAVRKILTRMKIRHRMYMDHQAMRRAQHR